MIRPLRRNPRDSQCNLLIHRVCELADDCRKWKLPAPSAKRRAWNTNRENLFRDSVFRLMMEINCGKTSRVHVTLELLDGNRRWKIFSLAAHFVIVNLYRHDVAHGGERSMKEGKRRADMPASLVAESRSSSTIPITIVITQHDQFHISCEFRGIFLHDLTIATLSPNSQVTQPNVVASHDCGREKQELWVTHFHW